MLRLNAEHFLKCIRLKFWICCLENLICCTHSSSTCNNEIKQNKLGLMERYSDDERRKMHINQYVHDI